VFGDAARAADLRILEQWREKLGPIGIGLVPEARSESGPLHLGPEARSESGPLHLGGNGPLASRIGMVGRLAFGRSSSAMAELMPALELALPGGRMVRLVGQTELLVRRGAGGPIGGTMGYASVIPLIGKAEKRSRHHLRGALDHVVLAAAGLSTGTHEHLLLDPEGTVRSVQHAPWSQHDAREYLTSLVGELLDQPHGYLLPFDHLVSGLAGKAPGRIHGDAIATLLGFGPIDRIDGLVAPPDPGSLAKRRLAPLVSRMTGDHSLGGNES
jgi:hypothetical protein